MDKPLLSPLELEATITYNYEKLVDARTKPDNHELEDLFEARMNRALDDNAEVMVHIGKVATYES